MRSLLKFRKILSEHKKELKAKFKVKEVGIFGSYIRGGENKESDLDVLVEFEEDARISLIEFIFLRNFLSDILGVKVDLVEKKCLKPYIGRKILQEVIYV